jgi:hypothetical protein
MQHIPKFGMFDKRPAPNATASYLISLGFPMRWPSRVVRLSGRAPVCLIVLATIATFGASVAASFHLDDFTLISDPVITSPSGAWRLWRPLQTRPLTYFTFWLNYQLGG